MLVATTVLIKLTQDEISPPYGGCVALSMAVHYFTLASVMWMGAEALLMFLKVVMVFKKITVKNIMMISVTCWCIRWNDRTLYFELGTFICATS